MASNDLVLRPSYPVNRRTQRETVTIRDADLIFRNFSGKAGPYNAEGERSFAVVLDEALALDLLSRGMNVKPLKMREEDTEQMYYLPVAVSYKVRPPRIYMVTGDGVHIPLRKTMLNQDLISMMDNLELESAHMVIALSPYDVRGTKGKKAYAQSFFGHVRQDELEQEYASVEDMVLDDTEQHKHIDIIDGEFSLDD